MVRVLAGEVTFLYIKDFFVLYIIVSYIFIFQPNETHFCQYFLKNLLEKVKFFIFKSLTKS